MEELVTEESAVRLPATPQIISSETIAPASAVAVATAGAGASTATASAELGRRLLLAARAGDAQLVLALMAQGAPFTADWLGTSPLHLAAAGGHVGAAGVLLRAGVSRDARTKVERTPLHLAAAAGHARVAALLLDHGALLDCRDMLRMTPLHWACARGHAALAALLAARGADAGARCKFGRTPAALARRHPAAASALARALRDRDRDHRRTEEMVVEDGDIPEPKIFQTVQMQVPIEEKPTIKIQPKIIKPDLETETSQSDKNVGAAALLRQHGITLLPADDGGTVLSALQSGRTVVLSDAGKLMLKENSSQATPPVSAGAGSVTPVAGSGPPATGSGPPAAGSGPPPAGARVVLRARPARFPPRPGVKVFTVNKLTRTPAVDNTQIKYVHVPKDSPRRGAVAEGGAVAGEGAGAGAGAGGARGGVKIIMNKASFAKLVATAARAHNSGDNEPLPELGGAGPGVVCVPEQFVRSVSARYLRAQLLAAHAALAALAAELRRRPPRR